MSARSAYIANRARMTNMTVSVDETGNKAQVQLPGLALDDFDRSGNLNFCKLQSKLSAVRFFAYHMPNQYTGHPFLDYSRLTAYVFTFMASAKTEVTRDFYNLPVQLKVPTLAVNIYLAHVGTASISSIAELVDKDSGKLLARNVNQVVTVDKTTRKPTALPDWWKEQHKNTVIGNEKFVCPLLTVPEKTHKYKLHVPWSDVDAYKHTNYVSYIRFCFDAAMDGIQKGYFSKLEDDILNYNTKCTQVLFRKESLAAQDLVVATWEDTSDPYVIHFEITRDGDMLFQCTTEFYKPLTL